MGTAIAMQKPLFLRMDSSSPTVVQPIDYWIDAKDYPYAAFCIRVSHATDPTPYKLHLAIETSATPSSGNWLQVGEVEVSAPLTTEKVEWVFLDSSDFLRYFRWRIFPEDYVLNWEIQFSICAMLR